MQQKRQKKATSFFFPMKIVGAVYVLGLCVSVTKHSNVLDLFETFCSRSFAHHLSVTKH